MVLKSDYDTLKLKKVTYDVIFMTSKRLYHRKYVKMTSQKFSINYFGLQATFIYCCFNSDLIDPSICRSAAVRSGVAREGQLGARALGRRPWGCINTLYSTM